MMSPGNVAQGHNAQVTGGLPGSIRHLLPRLLKKPVLSQTPLEASVSSTVIWGYSWYLLRGRLEHCLEHLIFNDPEVLLLQFCPD